MLERDGVREAAIIHDAILLEEPGLIASVAGALRLAVANDRLTAEVEAQLQEVRASRARIVEAGDVERRRVERDLHDGAQQPTTTAGTCCARPRGLADLLAELLATAA